ncbi:unnamed protein product, partial [Porites evermanni]
QGTEGGSRTDVYVSIHGQDVDNCGPQSEPCRSIAKAVQQVVKNGRIHLDGSGTKDEPFDCKSRLTNSDQYWGISIDKSVSIERLDSTPHVKCEKGFHFHKDKVQKIKITLSGIAFEHAPLVFDDCYRIQLINCSYKNAGKGAAVRIRTQTIPTLHLHIQGPSLFQNNQRCIEVWIRNKRKFFLTLRVNNTIFQENGLQPNQSTRAVISIRTNIKSSSSVRADISVNNVTSVENKAPFMLLAVPTANTKEVYSHVKLLNNNLRSSNSTNSARRYMDSMYISQVTKTDSRFHHFLCGNNSNDLALRCIKISSSEAKLVKIENSLFVGQTVTKGKGGALSIECKGRASLVVKNTTFERNKAYSGGGAIFFNGAKGNLRFELTNVNFSECESETQGSAFLVGKTHGLIAKPINYDLNAHFRNVRVKNCAGSNSSVCVMRSGFVEFERFHWENTVSKVSGGIFVASTGTVKTNVSILKSNFTDSHYNGSVFVRIEALKKHRGKVLLANTSMYNNQNIALIINPKYEILLKNVTIAYCRHGLQTSNEWLFPSELPLKPVEILIENCTFKRNVYDVSITVREARSVSFTVNNTNFIGQSNGHAIRFYMPAVGNKTKTSRATVKIDKVIFDARPASCFALYFQGKKYVTIRRSTFRHCTSVNQELWNYGDSKFAYETATGAVSILSNLDKRYKTGCLQRNISNNTHPLWRYDTHVIVEDTLFQENTGLNGGAVYLSNGNTTFRNCSFENNLAAMNTGQVYSAYGTGRVEFVNCSFVSNTYHATISGRKFKNVAFFYSESGGPIKFRNSSMFSSTSTRRSFSVLAVYNGGYVDIDCETSIRCEGSQMSLANATRFVYTEKRQRLCIENVTILSFSCKLCSPGYYSLQTGFSKGLAVDDSFQCHPCPLGATCIRNESSIAAVENFWGYNVSGSGAQVLNFVPCPKGYCRSPSPRSLVYNSCHGNRSGFLCGQCAPGYTEALFNSECRKTAQCKDYLFWVAIILFSAALALYLLIDPPLLRLLSPQQILWFMKKQERRQSEESSENCEERDSGYTKIAFYYYQVADLLLSNSLDEMPLVVALISAFNFQVRASYLRIDCPFPGLTPVTKELLLSLVVVATMANLALIFCAHLVISRFHKKLRKPSLSRYMAVFLEILLLGYDRLAETSLALMHCVSTGDEHRLFIDGTTICWQPWQYILLGYIVVFVVPFIAVLYCGSLKLHRSYISSGEFLASCVIPLPFLIYWLFKHVFKRRNEENRSEEAAARLNNSAEVMKVLHEPFRAPNDRGEGTHYWESVMIGRRLILLTFHSFIPNAMIRLFFMASACDFMAILHIIKAPFRSKTANKAETMSLVTLAIIAKISLVKATLLSSGISAKGTNKDFLEGLQWFELAAMGLVPAFLFLLAALAILSQTFRLIIYIVKKIARRFRKDTSIEELTEPLCSSNQDYGSC